MALENEKKEKIMKRAFIELLPETTATDIERALKVYTRRVQVLEQYLDHKFDDAIYNVVLPRQFDVRERFFTWRERCRHKSFNYSCTHCYMHEMLIGEPDELFNFELTYTIGFRGKSFAWESLVLYELWGSSKQSRFVK